MLIFCVCRFQVVEKDFSVTVSVSEVYVRLMESDERVRFEVSGGRRHLDVYDVQDEYVGELISVDREFLMPLLTRYCFADLKVYGEVSYVEEGGGGGGASCVGGGHHLGRGGEGVVEFSVPLMGVEVQGIDMVWGEVGASVCVLSFGLLVFWCGLGVWAKVCG